LFTNNIERNLEGKIIIGKEGCVNVSSYTSESKIVYVMVNNAININEIRMYYTNITYLTNKLRFYPFGLFSVSFSEGFYCLIFLEEALRVYKNIENQADCSSSSLIGCTCSGKIKDQFPEIYIKGANDINTVIDSNRYMNKV